MSMLAVSKTAQPDFSEVVHLIAAARQHAYQAVNTTLIELYWQVGAYISNKIKAAEWGDGVVDALAQHLAITQPNLKGFTRPNLFRMRQFYETYQADQIVSALLRQLPWTHNLTILSRSKHPEEREFYLRMAAQEKWSSRELERQFNTALFERVVLHPVKVSAALTQMHPEAMNVFKDSYVVDFLNLPQEHSEADLHQGLLGKLKHFLLELGRDFCFVGSAFPVQVGIRPSHRHPRVFHHRHPRAQPHRHPRALLSGIQHQPSRKACPIRDMNNLDSRQKHAGMTVIREVDYESV